jgi:hypothetical protein
VSNTTVAAELEDLQTLITGRIASPAHTAADARVCLGGADKGLCGGIESAPGAPQPRADKRGSGDCNPACRRRVTII